MQQAFALYAVKRIGDQKIRSFIGFFDSVESAKSCGMCLDASYIYVKQGSFVPLFLDLEEIEKRYRPEPLFPPLKSVK